MGGEINQGKGWGVDSSMLCSAVCVDGENISVLKNIFSHKIYPY